VTGQRHPDHEFLYRVGTSKDGRPIWGSILQSKIPTGNQGRESELDRPVDIHTPPGIQNTELGSDSADKS
jgi:hypothetical protein